MKTKLSILLALALMLTSMLPLMVVPVTAEATVSAASDGGIDMLVLDNIMSTSKVKVTVLDDGSWLIKSTAAGSLGIAGPGAYDASVLKYTHVAITSDVPFYIWFYDAANGKEMTSKGDFFPVFNTSYNQPAPAGTYVLALNTYGCYTWDGSALPANVEMSDIYIEPLAAGTMVLSCLELSDQNVCSQTAPTLPGTTTTTKRVTTTTRDVQGEIITYSLGSVTSAVGDIVEIPVTVSDNHYMINGQIVIEYDANALELQKVTDDEDNPYFESVNNAVFKGGTMWAFDGSRAGYTHFAFASAAKTGQTTGGTMYTLTFKILEGITDSTTITLSIPEMCSNDGTINGGRDYNTDVAVANGVVTWDGTTKEPTVSAGSGDVTGDGIVDMFDALALYAHVAGVSSLPETTLCEGDVAVSFGIVDMFDALALYKTVSGQ